MQLRQHPGGKHGARRLLGSSGPRPFFLRAGGLFRSCGERRGEKLGSANVFKSLVFSRYACSKLLALVSQFLGLKGVGCSHWLTEDRGNKRYINFRHRKKLRLLLVLPAFCPNTTPKSSPGCCKSWENDSKKFSVLVRTGRFPNSKTASLAGRAPVLVPPDEGIPAYYCR